MKNVGMLHRLYVWLCRLGHCRGFGVQSPWAYSFVRYVINEHFPYYKYAVLRKRLPALGTVERKVCELYFRLSNFARLRTVILCSSSGGYGWHDAVGTYFKAGLRQCEVMQCGGLELTGVLHTVGETGRHPLAVVIDAAGASGVDVGKLPGMLASGDYILIEDLRLRRDAAELWKRMYDGIDRGALFFDMYYCGVVYIDPERYKAHYKINF